MVMHRAPRPNIARSNRDDAILVLANPDRRSASSPSKLL